MRSTIVLGGVGFNTLILFSEEYAVEHTAMRRKIKITEQNFLVNLHLHVMGLIGRDLLFGRDYMPGLWYIVKE